VIEHVSEALQESICLAPVFKIYKWCYENTMVDMVGLIFNGIDRLGDQSRQLHWLLGQKTPEYIGHLGSTPLKTGYRHF